MKRARAPNARAVAPKPYAVNGTMRAPLLDALATGSTYRTAAGAAGIPWRTWCTWLQKVDAGECTDPDVVALVTDARLAYERASVTYHRAISTAAVDDWKAAAWALEHRGGDPKRRHDARRARYEAEIARNRAAGTHVETVRHVGEMTDEDLHREARKLLGLADGDDPRTTH